MGVKKSAAPIANDKSGNPKIIGVQTEYKDTHFISQTQLGKEVCNG